MKSFISLLKFNNVVPLAVTFLMLGAASTYAATNPETFVQKEEKVIAIDNTYIASINLKKYTPTAQVTAVREDDEFYYADYTFKTISLVDHVWQKISTEETMEVGKKRLGGHRDLGLFVTDQLRQKIAGELARLKETQTIEKKNISQKQVATVYSGLIGGFIDSKTKTIDGYKPVVEAPEKEPEAQTFARPDPDALAKKQEALPKYVDEEEEIKEEEEEISDTTEQENDLSTSTPETATSTTQTGTTTPNNNSGGSNSSGNASTTATSTENTAPILTILGENPARVELNATYTDLGATVSDDHDLDSTVELYLNGIAVETIVIDTSATGTFEIMYESTDSKDLIAHKIRIVEVYNPSPVEEDEDETTSTTTSPVEETPQPTTTPETKDLDGEGDGVAPEVPYVPDEKVIETTETAQSASST